MHAPAFCYAFTYSHDLAYTQRLVQDPTKLARSLLIGLFPNARKPASLKLIMLAITGHRARLRYLLRQGG